MEDSGWDQLVQLTGRNFTAIFKLTMLKLIHMCSRELTRASRRLRENLPSPILCQRSSSVTWKAHNVRKSLWNCYMTIVCILWKNTLIALWCYFWGGPWKPSSPAFLFIDERSKVWRGRVTGPRSFCWLESEPEPECRSPDRVGLLQYTM